jgi:acyl carrier protein
MTSDTIPEIEREIQAIARDRFDWIGDPDSQADLRRDLDLDSLHLVELQVALEDRFNVTFDPFDEQLVEAFQTIGHLAAYIDYLTRKEG